MICSGSQAQYYNLGQDPASVRWRQIKTDHFNLIYPTDFEENAQYLTNLFEYMYEYGTRSLEYKPSRIPVVIHNRNTVPNAFSVWAPRRIELYTCPPQNTYAQDWLAQLAIHEYRHVVQMEMMNRGFTKGMTWFLGEQATAAITGLFVPMWFLEGDAVCTETALSHSGRGRLPSFEMEIRTQVLQKGLFNYDKAVFGSFKDYVPDQYALGYQIVANTRKNFGYKTWIAALDVVAKRPYQINPMNVGLKKRTGFTKSSLYLSNLQELDRLWRFQASKESNTPVHQITPLNTRNYTNYKYPHYIDGSLLIAERTSMDDISRFVMIDMHGNEKVLYTPGFFSADMFSVSVGDGYTGKIANKPGSYTADNISIGKRLLAWTELETDPRWQNRNYSVIRIYDFDKGKTRKLTRRSRIFAPAISPDGTTILAVKVSENNTTSLIIIDIETGGEIRTLLSSKSEMYMNPSWSPEGKRFVFSALNQHGKSISVFDLEKNTVKQMLKPGFTEISNPVFAGKYILFNGSYSGIENIFSIDTLQGNVFQVTSAAFGACNAQYNQAGNKIAYSDYSSSGYSLVEAEFSPSLWKPLSDVQDHSPSIYKHLLTEETGIVDSTSLTHNNYISKPYRKAAHLINFHSWAPAYINYQNSETNTGISFMSQNVLSTASATVGYDWDYSGQAGLYRVGLKWEGWYPVLDLDASYGKRARFAKHSEGDPVRYSWNETSVSGGIKLPLIFSMGKYYTGLQAITHTTWVNISDNTSADSSKVTGTFNTIDYRIYIYHYLKQTLKDLYPGWGQVADFNYRHAPFGNHNFGTITSVAATFFFPGIFRHNGFKLYAGYQKKSHGEYAFADLVNIPRGYLAMKNDQMMSFGCNYKFPFLYPDLAMGSVAYIKRVKANLFYDHALYHNSAVVDRYNSAGVEITTDIHILRFLLPFDTGARIGYRIADKRWFAEFLLSVNLAI